MEDLNWEKSRIRSQIREYRKLLTEDELKACGRDLLDEFKAVLKQDKELKKIYDKARFVAMYKAVGGELPCDALAEFIRSSGKKTLYPRVCGEKMDFVEVKDPRKELVKGSFGIPEPSASAKETSKEQIGIVIMPGIAFDREGNRLGQGKGFYDRWLSSFPEGKRPFLIGVCMEFQMMSAIPVSSSDIPADMILCI